MTNDNATYNAWGLSAAAIRNEPAPLKTPEEDEKERAMWARIDAEESKEWSEEN